MSCPARSLQTTTIGGRGTRKAVSLPRQHSASQTQGAVLVVDDSRANRMILERQLQSLGYQVQQAKNGSEALLQLRESSFDAVLMDCQMPEMDGYEATRRLRFHEGTRPRTVVIALTANTCPGHRDACLAAGMNDYLNKPITKEELAQILDRWLPYIRGTQSK